MNVNISISSGTDSMDVLFTVLVTVFDYFILCLGGTVVA